jgi:hypothetical protein
LSSICAFSFVLTSLFLRPQVLRGKSHAYLKHCRLGRVRARRPNLVSVFPNDPLDEEERKKERGRPSVKIDLRPSRPLSSFCALKCIRSTVLNVSSQTQIMQLRYQWTLFSPSDLCLIFFGTNALLRICATGATFGPDTPAISLHVDCRDRYIMGRLLLPNASLMTCLLPIGRPLWRTRLQRLDFLDVTYQLI